MASEVLAGDPSPGSDRMAEVAGHLFVGQKIRAIKVYRAWKQVGLADAKREVEAIDARLRAEIPERFTVPANKGCAGAVLLVVLSAAAGFWLM